MTRVAAEPKIAAPIITADTLKSSVAAKGIRWMLTGSSWKFDWMMYATHNTTIAPMMTLGFFANFGIETPPPLARLERLPRRVNAAQSRHRISHLSLTRERSPEHREGG
jgi:hypothetical protein